MEVITDALTTGADPNISDAYTINGEPGDLYDCSNETTYHLAVKYGKTYLLRIINAILNEETFFGIADHNLTVVGTDGAYVKPVTVDYIVITPGQTMDVLVTANKAPSYYYIAGSPFADTVVPFDNTTTTAIFEYKGNYTPHHPFRTSNGDRLSASLNNVSFDAPSMSILQAYYWNLSKDVYTTDFPEKPPTYFDFTGNVDNITLYTSLGPSFYLVGKNKGNFDNATDPLKYNLIDPPEVNTIGLPKNGWAAIRFYADNPDENVPSIFRVWFMHCHLERHSRGMDTVLIVKNGGTKATSIRPPPAYMPPCSKS
ncbi:hypothetical protein GH714_023985 [Hevea brasiliensis]|uniref:laccase n=1 Tax=Hevea brasiliensis TaxID=3981 RepID=A0A6A6LAZ7_HEVBR|nr:hypothetical protein GH714_023985 [Hevea brasiliensis]